MSLRQLNRRHFIIVLVIGYGLITGSLLAMSIEIPAWFRIASACVAGAAGVYWIWVDYHVLRKSGSRDLAEGFSDGDSVEVDCRLCGQFNRVAAPRLRDHPICGRCKTRLMPGHRVVICRTSPIRGPLRGELDAVWLDEDRLWGCLADHLVQKSSTPSTHTDRPRQVN